MIEELYTFLRQADARELGGLFKRISMMPVKPVTRLPSKRLQKEIDNFQTHVVPIIADIDAGFGNAEATYLLAKKMIEAGACAIQLENQVSDEKQCGHQDGKVTVPHEDFLAKIRAVRYAFLELGVDDGVIVARTDSLGAGLTKQIAVTTRSAGDLGDQYNSLPGNWKSWSLLPTMDARRRDHQATTVSWCVPSSPAVQRPVPASASRYRRRSLRIGQHHQSLQKRRRSAVDRDREAARIGQIGGMVNEYPRGDPQCQAGLQQQHRPSTGR